MKSKNILLAAAGVAAAGLAAPSIAHDPPSRQIIIKRMGPDGRPVRLEGADSAKLISDCSNEDKAESDVVTGDGKSKHRTRVVICTPGGANSPETRRKLADALEKARDGLSDHQRMSPERRAEAQAALDREIARLRGESRD